MARVDTLPHFLTDIADAIRTKGSTSSLITASDFDTAIANLPSGSSATLITKSITANGTYNASDDSADGYSQVSVSVPTGITPTGNINITDMNVTNVTNYATAQVVDSDLVASNIKKDVNILGVVGTYEASGGGGPDWSAIGYSDQPQAITDGYNYAKNIYDNWVQDVSYTAKFQNDANLIFMPLVDTSTGTNFMNMFGGCTCLISIPQLDTSAGANFNSMFYTCYTLKSIPQLDTSAGTNFGSMFQNCDKIKSIPQLNMAKASRIDSMFSSCNELETLGGLVNLGQAFQTNMSAHYSRYKLTLNSCTKLTHDSLMNVINNLYDIATAGVQTQDVVMSSTNLAKLTTNEIAIATNKGWTVS